MTAPTQQRRRPAVSEYDAQILALVATGRTTRQIGLELGRTTAGIQSHLSKLYRRMGVRNAPHAVAAAIRAGILTVDRPAGRQ
ncbi:helix-turn-helix transcriptional regulator [Micromonospora sp. NPDC005324]|uniref:helix-turn-helix transcriptional regulator n=1 Tax=Micromonospora sp. NPDC005324 TaxID=3157033 RepID=UPI0033B6F530